MASNTGVRVEGARELRATLRRAGESLEELKDANAKVAQFVAALAQARAPKRSGKLAATVKGNRAAGNARIQSGRASVPYAGPIHYGWPARNITASPFMIEAAQSSEARWSAMYMDEIEKIIKKVEGD